MSETRQYCTFYVHDSLFGVAVEHVQEILRCQPLTRIPLAPEEVAGLMNLRGQIVPAIDLRRGLGTPARPDDVLPTNLVVRTGEGAVSLLADEIGDILALDASTFEPPPEHLRGPVRAVIRGVHKLAAGLMMVLSVEDVVALSTAAVAGDPVLSEAPRAPRGAA